LLDGNLNGENSEDVADELANCGTPFAFVSGYGREHLPPAHGDRPILAKPFPGSEIRKLLEQLVAQLQPSTVDAARK
jgi:hypothetical protein